MTGRDDQTPRPLDDTALDSVEGAGSSVFDTLRASPTKGDDSGIRHPESGDGIRALRPKSR